MGTEKTTGGPFSGLLVLDLTRVLAGPYAALLLGELGARVTKIEPPEGDDARRYGPFVTGESGSAKSGYFMSINRGKESIALDLKKNEDRHVFEALLARADVLIENYRGGTMEKLGYGWESLKDKYPRLIYAAVSGFGHTGPYAARPAYDMVVQAMGGIMSLTGHPGGPPTRVGTSVGDITAGLFATIGILSALYHRRATGEATKVDVGMLDSQIAILENAIVRYQATGQPPGPIGARHPSIAPFEAYATADGHIVIAAGNDALFRRVADALDAPALKDNPKFATNALRCEHVEALKAALEAVLTAHPTSYWLERLEAAGVPSGPLNNVPQALSDPQVLARNMVVTVTDALAGSLKLAGNPVKLSGFPDPETRPPAPELDADREAILREFLGEEEPAERA